MCSLRPDHRKVDAQKSGGTALFIHWFCIHWEEKCLPGQLFEKDNLQCGASD